MVLHNTTIASKEACLKSSFHQDRFRQQVNLLRRQFLQDGDLPFTNVLSEQIVSQALTASKVFWNDSIYPPLVTLWIFLSQVLSAGHSCRTAVVIPHRLYACNLPVTYVLDQKRTSLEHRGNTAVTFDL